VALTSPGVGATLNGLVSLVATANDDFGVASVQFLVDGITSGAPMTAAPYAWSWDTNVVNGPHTLTAVARDTSGNEASASVVVNVANDHGAPLLTLNGPAGVVGGIASIVANASDDIGVVSVEFLVDANIPGPVLTAAPYEWSLNTVGLANGPHTVWALARDAAGHETVSSATVTVLNDLAAPTVTLLDPVGGSTLRGTVMVGATAADDVGVVSVEFLVDGGVAVPAIPGAPYQSAWNTTSVVNGLHTVTAVARDAAGHATASTVEVTVDNNGS